MLSNFTNNLRFTPRPHVNEANNEVEENNYNMFSETFLELESNIILLASVVPPLIPRISQESQCLPYAGFLKAISVHYWGLTDYLLRGVPLIDPA